MFLGYVGVGECVVCFFGFFDGFFDGFLMVLCFVFGIVFMEKWDFLMGKMGFFLFVFGIGFVFGISIVFGIGFVFGLFCFWDFLLVLFLGFFSW